MPGPKSSRLIAVCAAGILLASCDDAPPPGSQSGGPSGTKPKRVTAGVVAPEMVAAVSSTRNAAVVGVHFMLNGSPSVNKALPVDIALVPHEAIGTLRAHFEAREGLALATGNVLEALSDPKPEQVIKHQLVLLPSKEGVFMVTVIIDTETGDGSISRIFSIPVIVAPEGTTNPAPDTAADAPTAPAAVAGS
jgi:hypothetical protein